MQTQRETGKVAQSIFEYYDKFLAWSNIKNSTRVLSPIIRHKQAKIFCKFFCRRDRSVVGCLEFSNMLVAFVR